MRKTLFYCVLFAIPLAAGANAPESETQDPEIEQGLNTQEQRGQETDPQFEEATQETEQEFDEAAQETEQEFEEAGSEMEQETEAQFEQTGEQDMSQQGQQQAGAGEPELKRAQFTTNVQDKEPVDEVENVEASEDPIYFFTEVENAEGQTITHRWKRDGEVMAEVPLEVGSNDWRTWSSKELMPDWDGEWTVEVVDAEGNTISEESVTVERGQQQQNVGYSPEDQEQQQEGQMQEAGQQDQQTESEDWQDVEFQDDAQTEDVEAETETQEEDWQSVEYEDTAQDQEQQQDEQAAEDQEDWMTQQ